MGERTKIADLLCRHYGYSRPEAVDAILALTREPQPEGGDAHGPEKGQPVHVGPPPSSSDPQAGRESGTPERALDGGGEPKHLRDPHDHAFLAPNTDYCALCGMDREAHSGATPESPTPTQEPVGWTTVRLPTPSEPTRYYLEWDFDAMTWKVASPPVGYERREREREERRRQEEQEERDFYRQQWEAER